MQFRLWLLAACSFFKAFKQLIQLHASDAEQNWKPKCNSIQVFKTQGIDPFMYKWPPALLR